MGGDDQDIDEVGHDFTSIDPHICMCMVTRQQIKLETKLQLMKMVGNYTNAP